jgi:hypothetical protein
VNLPFARGGNAAVRSLIECWDTPIARRSELRPDQTNAIASQFGRGF